MKIHVAQQGSEEWHKARAGAITASMFSTIRDVYKQGKNKGGYKAAALDYAWHVASERVAGTYIWDDSFDTSAARRGRKLEPEARRAHAFQLDLEIEEAGFVSTDDGRFGASADGLINDSGGSEYKCLISPGQLRTIISEGVIDKFYDQIQGCMWLAERDWWHFVLYCPFYASIGADLYIQHVERDDEYIAQLQADLLDFDKQVEEYMEEIRDFSARAGVVNMGDGLMERLEQTSAEGIFG